MNINERGLMNVAATNMGCFREKIKDMTDEELDNFRVNVISKLSSAIDDEIISRKTKSNGFTQQDNAKKSKLVPKGDGGDRLVDLMDIRGRQ